MLALRAALSGSALAWIIHAIPLRSIGATLRQADLWLLLAGLGLSLLARLAAAERNFALSRALGLPISRSQTVTTLFISNFYSLLAPGPVLGGAVTVYRYRNHGASVSGSLAALLGSRALECAAFILGGGVGLLLDPRAESAPLRLHLLVATTLLLAGGAALLLCGWRLTRPSSGPGDGAPHWQHRLRDACRGAFEVLRHASMRALLPATLQILLGAAALGTFAAAIGAAVPLLSALWVSAVVYVVVLLPISISGLGVREVALIHCLAVLGIAANAAVAVSVLLFLDPLLNAVIGGLMQGGLVGSSGRLIRD
jgi:uncharacterized membrane protein YbhN (UPF0104 family)